MAFILCMPSWMLLAVPAQNIGIQFIAATMKDVAFSYRAQPNVNGWVGPQQYIEFTNQNIRSFNKKTGLAHGVLDSDSASIIGTPITDPRLTFDRWGQRWIMLGDLNNFANTSTPGVAIAYTDGPIITSATKWTVQVITDIDLIGMPGTTDSPSLASDQNAVYINIDMFNPPETIYYGVAPVVIPQASFVAGNAFDYTVFPLQFTPAEYPITGGYFIAPSPNNFDPNPEFGYILQAPTINEAGILTYTNYLMFRILNPGSTSPSLYPASPISLAAPIYTDGTLIPHLGNLYGANGLLQNTGTTLS